MMVRVIVQKKANGEKHVTYTQDQTTPVEDMLVGGEWAGATVIEGRVLLLGMDDPDNVLEELVDVELHTAWTPHSAMGRVDR